MRIWSSTVVSLFTAWAGLFPTNAESQTLPDIIDQLRPTIVRIKVVCNYQSGVRRFATASGGTGFWVSKTGLALTAAHVGCPPSASDPATAAPGTLTEEHLSIGLALPHTATDQTQTRENFTYVAAERLEIDRIHDVALVRAVVNPFQSAIKSGYTLNGKELELVAPRTAPLSSRIVREGDSIAVSGYPLDQSVFDTNAGIVASIHSDRGVFLPTFSNSSVDCFGLERLDRLLGVS